MRFARRKAWFIVVVRRVIYKFRASSGLIFAGFKINIGFVKREGAGVVLARFCVVLLSFR